jgi:hypothetical protein
MKISLLILTVISAVLAFFLKDIVLVVAALATLIPALFWY